MTRPLPLFERVPGLAAREPWLPLGTYPTPLVQLQLETRAGRIPLLVKRDDLTAGTYGGNKVRKLEFLLGAARAAGARRVITAGAFGSHHALATSIYATRLGLHVTLVLFPQARTAHVRDVLLMDHALGAELRFVRRMTAVPLGLLAARLAHRRDRPRVIPPGGSDGAGTLGYVNAGLELAAQLAAGGAPSPGVIHVAAGTLGTAAGLALGLAMAGLDVPIMATRIAAPIVTNRRVLRRLVTDAHGRLRRAGAELPPVHDVLPLVELRHDQLGAGYGRATAAAQSALAQFAGLGLTLDLTYTAKAAATLLASEPRAAGPPLFWHTLSAHEPRHLLDGVQPATLPAPFAEYVGEARP